MNLNNQQDKKSSASLVSGISPTKLKIKMGYDLQRFKDEVSEEFICSICTGVLKDPVIAPECEHTFCRACISDWLNVKPKCPIDNSVVNLEDLRSVPRIIKNLLAKLVISCDFASNGCSIFVKTEDLDAHVVECAYNLKVLVPCEKNCGLNVLRGAVNDHNCVKELRKCLDAMKLEHQGMTEKLTELSEKHANSTAEYAKLAEEHTQLIERLTKLEEKHTKIIEKQTKLEDDHAISISKYIKQLEELKKLAEEHTKSNSDLKQELNQLKTSLELKTSSTLGEIKSLHELRTVQESIRETQENEDSKQQLEHLICEKSNLSSKWWKQLGCCIIEATKFSLSSRILGLDTFLQQIEFARQDLHKFVLCECASRGKVKHDCGLEKLEGFKLKIRRKFFDFKIFGKWYPMFLCFILKFENTHVPNDLIPKCGFAFTSKYINN